MTSVTTFFRRPRQIVSDTPEARPTGIIDIGSNSIRLVVYQGPARLPSIMFNEKVMAGLGRGLGETGAIAPAALEAADKALARFAALAREMNVDTLQTVATAAVRDASNGHVLLEAGRRYGLDVELLSGEQEAMAAGHGVLSAIPQADGIVGDLGGGSLELVRVRGGAVHDRVSFPLGVLRIGAIRKRGVDALDKHVTQVVRAAGWRGAGAGLPLYLVGGSWRTLARLDMHTTNFPLPVIHGYTMAPATIDQLADTLSKTERASLKSLGILSNSRIPTLADAAALLASLMRQLGSSTTVASAFGLREGLLHQRLSPAQRAIDPLIAAARDEGERLGRFPEHGDLIDRWIAPLFSGESAEDARLRHAACLLGDVAWRANPEFRAERGLEIALHGNWVAIDTRGRAMLAQALYTSFGGGSGVLDWLKRLASEADLKCAVVWGLAIRLGQRLSGGVAGPLKRTKLGIDPASVWLQVAPADHDLYGEAVERRHKSLASAFSRVPALLD